MGKFSGLCFNFCRTSDVDRKATRAFSRRGSLIHSETPSTGSNKNDSRDKNADKPRLEKSQSDKEEGMCGANVRDRSPDDCSASSTNMAAEKYREELKALKEELEDLRRKLVEQNKLLKSPESLVQSQVDDELRLCVAEKDSLITTTLEQFGDAKIKLADREASIEKLEREAQTSDKKVLKLQEELNSIQSEISSFMLLFEGLSNDNPVTPADDYDIKPLYLDCLPDIDEMEEKEMEEARQAYMGAVDVAKEKQDEESLAAAVQARLHLQSFVFKTHV